MSIMEVSPTDRLPHWNLLRQFEDWSTDRSISPPHSHAFVNTNYGRVNLHLAPGHLRIVIYGGLSVTDEDLGKLFIIPKYQMAMKGAKDGFVKSATAFKGIDDLSKHGIDIVLDESPESYEFLAKVIGSLAIERAVPSASMVKAE